MARNTRATVKAALTKIGLAATLLFALYLAVEVNTLSVGPQIAEGAPGGTAYMPHVLYQLGRTFYLSPTGNDARSGGSPSEAWATFERAWQTLGPGDTLILRDGIYYQSVVPKAQGAPTDPITIRAEHDGKAIIDGQGVRRPFDFPYKIKPYYMVIEGIVARNSSAHVFRLASNIVLRRVSAYNAHTDENGAVIGITGSNNLLEDCIAAGTGRKMIVAIGPDAQNNTIRRCLTDWREWDGRNWCGSHYPWGEGLEFYNASNNLMENSIAYGHTPRAGISIMAQGPRGSTGNRVLGSMAFLSGMKEDGTKMLWGPNPNIPPLTQVQALVRPGPTDCTALQQFDDWPGLRNGIRLGASGTIKDNFFQDIFAWGSAGPGLDFHMVAYPFENNHVNRATIYHNGLDNGLGIEGKFGGIGVDAFQEGLDRFDSITNSYIGKIYKGSEGYTTINNGEGARLTHRYVDGVLTNQLLWPWPMEDRVQAELGYSITAIATGIIFNGDMPPDLSSAQIIDPTRDLPLNLD